MKYRRITPFGDDKSASELELLLLKLSDALVEVFDKSRSSSGPPSESVSLLETTLLESCEKVGRRLSEEESVWDPTRVGELEGNRVA